ncbi:MAG: aminotransferase class I/II-fold pyridoxal phosphate-dependent enzyme [Anaerolineaceae bacterium]
MKDTYLAERIIHLKPSGIRKYFDISAAMEDVISLGIGEPDFTTPPPILEEGIRSLQRGETHYTANAGNIELRRVLAAHLEQKYNVTYDPAKEIVITVGASEALFLSMCAILNPGEEVIIPTPCFVSYQADVELAGGKVVEIPSLMENGFALVPENIEKAITPKTKAIFIGYPCNPTGAVASRETLLEVARIAEKYDLIVISDEIYDRLIYNHTHICFPSLPGMKERTILLGGFSKDYAMTGWRVGYACAPKGLVEGMLRIHQYLIMSAPSTAQAGALQALRIGEEFVVEMVEEYDRRRKLIVGGFNQLGLPTFEPKGAFYCFPRVSACGLDDETFCTRLLQEQHVAMIPGHNFGAGGEGFARASYATAYEKIEQALVRIEKFLKTL